MSDQVNVFFYEWLEIQDLTQMWGKQNSQQLWLCQILSQIINWKKFNFFFLHLVGVDLQKSFGKKKKKNCDVSSAEINISKTFNK